MVEELRDGAENAAAEHGVDSGLANVPVPRRQQPYRSVHRIHGPSTGFVQQRLKQRRAMGGGDIGDEVDEAGAAEELGEEDGGVGLRFRGLDPLKTRAEHAGLAAAFA